MSPLRISLVAVSVAVTACPRETRKDAAAVSYAVADYYPLAIGNRWTFEGTAFGRKDRRTISLVGRQGPYFVDDTGQAMTLDGEGLRDRDRYLLKAPLRKGAHWLSVLSVSSTERYEIAEAGFTTTVPAGTFHDCVLVRGRSRADERAELISEWTFAPRVGMVRIETYVARERGDPVPQVKMELADFAVKAP